MADPPTPSPPPTDDPSNDSLADYRGRVHDLEEKLGERDTLIEELREQVRGLEEKAGKNSGNSSRAPSTDTPEQRARRRRKPKSARNRGAQPGHPKHERALWPESALDARVNHLPGGRCGCGTDIVIVDEPLFRHQVFDVPVVKYTVVEHRLFGGVCPMCEDRHHGVLPRTVPSGQMGPNLVALIAGLSGDEQLSIRKIRKHLIEHFDLSFSVGAIFQAQGKMNAILAAPYRAIGEFVRSEPVVHADETRHFRGNNPYWLWVLAVGCACYFVTHYSRGKAVAVHGVASDVQRSDPRSVAGAAA